MEIVIGLGCFVRRAIVLSLSGTLLRAKVVLHPKAEDALSPLTRQLECW